MDAAAGWWPELSKLNDECCKAYLTISNKQQVIIIMLFRQTHFCHLYHRIQWQADLLSAINDGTIVARKHGYELPRKDGCVHSIVLHQFCAILYRLFVVVAEAAKQSNAPADIVNQGSQ